MTKVLKLNIPYWMILASHLRKDYKPSHTEICKILNITYSHVSRTLKAFRIMKWTRTQKTGRKNLVNLTTSGREASSNCKKIITQLDLVITCRWCKKEIRPWQASLTNCEKCEKKP